MQLTNPMTRNLLLGIPVVGFMAVIDQAAWPLIFMIAVPLVLARYFPSKISGPPPDSEGSQSINESKGEIVLPFAIKPIHLIIVAIAIFLLNTSPKKLNRQSCTEEMALTTDELHPQYIITSRSFLR